MPFQAKLDHVALARRFFPNSEVYAASKPFLRGLMSGDRNARIKTAAEASAAMEQGQFPRLPSRATMGNHYHDMYSWSREGFRVSPAASAFISKVNGEIVTGQVNHYSMYGADEFRTACALFGLPCTTGYELRFWVRDPLVLNSHDLSKEIINAPNFPGMGYVVVHGSTNASNPFLQNAVGPKLARYEQITGMLNEAFAANGIKHPLEFGRIRESAEWDNVLDKHVLGEVFDVLYDEFGGRGVGFSKKVSKMLAFAAGLAGEDIDAAKVIAAAGNKNNYQESEYAIFSAVLDILREKLLACGRVGFIMPSEAECPSLENLSKIAGFDKSILTFPLLLRKAHGTENLYFDALYDELFGRLGFHAVSWMPNRTFIEDSEMVLEKTGKKGKPSISGMDVNKYLQRWLEDESADKRLILTTFMLVGHELAVRSGLPGFTENNSLEYPDNIEFFAKLGTQFGLRERISQSQYDQVMKDLS